MRKRIGLLILASMLASGTGCTICCSPYDYDYMSSGTKMRRADMVRGRVGSNLSDPNLMPTEYVEESPSDQVMIDEGIEVGP